MNIPDCYSDDRFDPTVDMSTGLNQGQDQQLEVRARATDIIQVSFTARIKVRAKSRVKDGVTTKVSVSVRVNVVQVHGLHSASMITAIDSHCIPYYYCRF